MLLQFIHLAADIFIVFWSVTILFIFILLGIKWVFVDRKFEFDSDAPSDGADVGTRAEVARSDAEAVERKNDVGGDEKHIDVTSTRFEQDKYFNRAELVMPNSDDFRIEDFLRAHENIIEKYAYILHEGNSRVDSHYHIYVSFYRPIGLRSLVDIFGRCICPMKSREHEILGHLLFNRHGGPAATVKDIVANFDVEQTLKNGGKK